MTRITSRTPFFETMEARNEVTGEKLAHITEVDVETGEGLAYALNRRGNPYEDPHNPGHLKVVPVAGVAVYLEGRRLDKAAVEALHRDYEVHP